MTRLKEMRLARNLSQSQLAAKAGIKVQVLQHYEQASRIVDNAKLSTLLNLCIALDCNLIDIVELEENREQLKKVRH